jgi:ParB/RepB/Spo0J family partition protein
MATKKTTTRTAKPAKSAADMPLETFEILPLKEVEPSFDNVRTGDFTQADSEESERGGQSFAELVESIKTAGQRTPVVVRPKGKKYQLISGFRRYAALKHIAQASGQKDGTIKAIVKQLDDLNATIENVTENSREDLTGPDLAFGLHRIAELQKAAGANVSDRALAALVGKNNSYVSTLLRIVRKAPKVAKLWHESSLQIGVREMATIAKIEEPALQMERYKELTAAKTSSGSGDGSGKGPGGKPWIDTAIAKAEAIAAILGTLEREECITVDMAWDEQLENLGVKLNSAANGRDRSKIAKKAREAYAAARDYEPEVEESEEGEAAAE